jgi:hypothetical protein
MASQKRRVLVGEDVSSQRDICCRTFAPALPENPAASVRDYCSGAYTGGPECAAAEGFIGKLKVKRDQEPICIDDNRNAAAASIISGLISISPW